MHQNSDNLQLIKANDHLKIHAMNSYKNFSQGVPKYYKITEIKYVGIEKTYDISCCEPYHNFVANGIVVHNSGKSVLAMQIAKILDPNFTENQIAFTPNEFIKLVSRAKKHQCIIFDEAFTGLSARGALSEINQLLVSLMMEMRQKNLFIIIVMPTVFMLDKYVVLHRARCLIHVHLRNHRRGFWKLYSKERMKLLWLRGRKEYNHNVVKAIIFGRFLNQYTVNEYTNRNHTILN